MRTNPAKGVFLVRGVAQPGSASVLGTEGRRFESCLPDQHFSGWLWVRFRPVVCSEHLPDILTPTLFAVGRVDSYARSGAIIASHKVSDSGLTVILDTLSS